MTATTLDRRAGETGMGKKDNAGTPPKKGSKWKDRKEYQKNVAVARDVADWIGTIVADETKRLPEGRLSIPELLDSVLREWAWQTVRPILEQQLGVKLPAAPPEPPPQFAVPEPSGGWLPARERS